MSSIVSGLATVGRVETYFKSGLLALFLCFVFSACVWMSITAFKHPDKHTASVVGSVQNNNCTTALPNSKVQECSGNISWVVDGKSYTALQTYSPNEVNNNNQVKVWYNPSDPSDGLVDRPAGAKTTLMFASSALVSLVIVILWIYIVRKNQSVAAFAGAGDVVGWVT